ncbi:competence protein CoiA [Acidovorax sp. Leaf73]|uniref:competence protein CoiA n=1 Tax=Acidovorax sp. Leaf73 TaxID=2876566 RepID=UPI001E3E4434|nr:competence protein CoiA family protein [Acidovorax sp. Leaf73]
MRFALVNGQRTDAQPKTRGLCPGCSKEVTAKCGPHKVWHWAHLRCSHCDPWWESETQWHRDWKNRFPVEWQEIPLQNPVTRELHIADVRTPNGLVIEFQRSTISPEEVNAREQFYQTIVWVVDGTKGQFDATYFNLSRGRVVDGMAYFKFVGRSKLFHRWHRHKPVFIDFGDAGFWRIASFDPTTKEGSALLVSRDSFAAHASSGLTDFSANGGPASI